MTKHTLPFLTALFAGCLLVIGCAESPDQLNVYTVPLTYNTPDEGPQPNFTPSGTRVPLEEVAAGLVLPAGATHPVRRGVLQVGPTRESWIPMLLTSAVTDPGVLNRLYLDMNRNGDFSDDGPPAPAILRLNQETGNGRIVFEDIELLVRFPDPERTEPLVVQFWLMHSSANPEPDSFIRYASDTFWRTGTVTVNGIPALVAAMDKNNDALYGPGDNWSVVEASMPEASKYVLWVPFEPTKGEVHSTDRLMFIQRGPDAADLVLEFRSFATDGSSITFAVVDHPISKAEDRLADNMSASEWTRPRSPAPYPWTNDLDGAIASAKDSGKRIFLYFEAEWCGPCKLMDQWIWTDAEVVSELRAGYVGVKLNFDDEEAHVRRFNVIGLPNILIVDPASGTAIRSVNGYQSSQKLLDFLRESGE